MTVLERLIQGGVDECVARRHLRYGRVRVDGIPTVDPSYPAEHAHVLLWTGEACEIDEVNAR